MVSKVLRQLLPEFLGFQAAHQLTLKTSQANPPSTLHITILHYTSPSNQESVL